MAGATMADVTTTRFASFDGVELAVHETGQGRLLLLLLHGLFSNAYTNWIKFGHAARLSKAGFRVVMPDLRAHGQSDAPHDPSAYPEDVLVADIRALIGDLAPDDYDIGGFSLGARTAAKLLTEGATPRRAILSGMGWEGLTGWGDRLGFFVDAIDRREEVERGDPHWMAVQFMKTTGIDPVAARLLLHTFGSLDTGALVKRDLPVLVLCGADDHDNGSGRELANRLTRGEYAEVPGTHMSSVTEPALGERMVEFLTREGVD